jgi:hypothetical protein
MTATSYAEMNRRRTDWSEVKDRIDMAAVATALLGPAPGRRGSRGLWWNCPFHDDKHPSLTVTPGKPWWKCFGCGAHGDAATLLMRARGLDFPRAVEWLADQAGIMPQSQTKVSSDEQREELGADPRQPSGIPLAAALALEKTAEKRLWTTEGAKALAYLRGRGLHDETIRSARLGITVGVSIPKKDGNGKWTASGITIPWFDGDRLALVKIRQPEGRRPKYGEAFRDNPAIFPGRSSLRPGKPLIMCEGEFDCLLLRQELAEYEFSIVTLGSASSRVSPAIQDRMLMTPTWYLALDADQAGDKNAATWPARAKRIRPPAPFKDWGDLHRAGFNAIRFHWGGILKRPVSPPEVLLAQRWEPEENAADDTQSDAASGQ